MKSGLVPGNHPDRAFKILKAVFIRPVDAA